MSLNFLKLDLNILNDNKIKIIRKFPDGDSLFVLWIGLLCLAMKSDNSGYIYITQGIPYTIDDLANEFNIEKKTVEMGLNIFKKYKMIDLLEGDIIEIINFNKHQELDKIELKKEQARIRAKTYREKQKILLLEQKSNANVRKRNAIDLDKDIYIDKDKDIEEIYNLYPSVCPIKKSSTNKCKKNKDQILKLLKEKEKGDIIKTINEYIEDCEKNKIWIKNFSTFLNQFPERENYDIKNMSVEEVEKLLDEGKIQ
jgi:predicted phage replisome organizer